MTPPAPVAPPPASSCSNIPRSCPLTAGGDAGTPRYDLQTFRRADVLLTFTHRRAWRGTVFLRRVDLRTFHRVSTASRSALHLPPTAGVLESEWKRHDT